MHRAAHQGPMLQEPPIPSANASAHAAWASPVMEAQEHKAGFRIHRAVRARECLRLRQWRPLPSRALRGQQGQHAVHQWLAVNPAPHECAVVRQWNVRSLQACQPMHCVAKQCVAIRRRGGTREFLRNHFLDQSGYLLTDQQQCPKQATRAHRRAVVQRAAVPSIHWHHRIERSSSPGRTGTPFQYGIAPSASARVDRASMRFLQSPARRDQRVAQRRASQAAW